MAMSRRKVIVKPLNAIQNFGAMNVLCTDKTGTLTQDLIILKRHLDIRGGESDRVLEYANLNSFYQSGLKNLLDVAVLKHVELEAGLKVRARFKKIDEMPFDFERRRMSVVIGRDDGVHILVCKGAVEEVFAVCKHYEIDGKTGPLDEGHFASAMEMTAKLNADGFRVVAVAYNEMPPTQDTYSVADEADLTLLGYIAFLDPPKETSAAAIATLKVSGVQVKILTGDNDIVTRKICREVGLPVDRIVLGSEMAKLSPDELTTLAETAAAFAKVSPVQKAAIIDAPHRKGHVVGFLGDGINDGPALKAADVGISVDSAVDIAKESADIILLEKSLAVLGEGVIEGRKVFGNITKYITTGASSNFGNMFSVLGSRSSSRSFRRRRSRCSPTTCCTTSRRPPFRPTMSTPNTWRCRGDGTSATSRNSCCSSDRSARSSITSRISRCSMSSTPGAIPPFSRPARSSNLCSPRRSSSTSFARRRFRFWKAVPARRSSRRPSLLPQSG
jgi:Mg2+-importing ATPase